MKTINKIILSLLVILSGWISANAQVDIITIDQFKDLAKANKELVILDGSKGKTYDRAHVQNAINVNHNDLYKDGDVSGVVKPVEDLAAFFGKLGISEKSEIVLYDEGSQKYSSRLYWILKYIGAENVKILHNDENEWKKARVMLTAQPPKARKPVTFTPTVNEAIYASTDYVSENIKNPEVIVVDVRTPEEYSGETAVSGDKKGHIPGSVNMDYVEVETETGAFKSKEDLMALAEKYGLSPDKEVIFLCKTSVRGAVAYVAFKNILGYENVKLYDGACAEWCTVHPLE
ncbi:MAG: sulfurtransferase [Saprospiraceae bacterium]|nr:sulfurtransferase [Saprospiraceae bacterium]MCB9325371.1 sulfurtransferase [Lewinellaceae bacterium]